MLNHTAAEISHPTGKKQTTQLKDIQKRLELRVLSQEDWDHWITKGFVVVKKAVNREACQQLENALWEFDEKDPNDPSTWYAPQRRPHVRVELNNVGMTEIYHHQRMWDNRQSQRVYDAFVDIWDQEELWVAIDRANINPPKKVKANPDGFVHWDVDTTARPLPIGVQGILSVKEQDIETGGFQAVPYLFEFFEDWVKTQPSDRNPLLPDMTGLSRENITLEAGDLLIFNSLLPHGVRPNHSEGRVRMAQYISMFPAELENESERAERIRLWQNIEAPNRPDFPGDPRGWEKQHYGPADLTQLGRKLLGLDLWGDIKT
ncbi:MAG: phytanoyl-CoA dioxygenase family protein [Planktomarina sp.]|jgi:hypothetical protein|nr:phytanoyl-CoA dioxygenase family protein [Planktomarina sp.]|tara:strand:+ start:558 stop:1511 length:954 start_codon:yes stop_codon:yes gene_type:complete